MFLRHRPHYLQPPHIKNFCCIRCINTLKNLVHVYIMNCQFNLAIIAAILFFVWLEHILKKVPVKNIINFFGLTFLVIKGEIDSSLLIPVERYCLIIWALLFLEEHFCPSTSLHGMEKR